MRESNSGENRIFIKALTILTVVAVMAILSIFVSRKEGFHMDELITYEFANAEYNPWVVPKQPEGRLAKYVREELYSEDFRVYLGNIADTVKDVLVNRGSSKLLSYKADVYDEPVWIDRQTFVNYMTVDNKDAFNYLSVYFNVKDDNHPPLHFMAIHTICSLVRGEPEAWKGCLVNLIFLAGALLLIMKSFRMLVVELQMDIPAESKLMGLVGAFAALLYGLSTGAVATILLTRMYCMVTFFCVALFSIVLDKYYGKNFERRNGWLILVTVLGFWTQYFFLFYCIGLFITVCVMLGVAKRTREMLIFFRSMVIAAVIGLVGFPFAISDVFSSGRGVEALENLSNGLNGYGERLLAMAKILGERTVGSLGMLVEIVIIAVVIFVVMKVKRGILAEGMIILTVPVLGYYLLASRMSPYLVDRYIMPIFPFVSMLFALELVACANFSTQVVKNRVTPYAGFAAIALALMIVGLVQYDGEYLYRGYEEQRQLSVEYGQYPCLLVCEGDGFYENMLEYTNYSQTLIVNYDQLENRQDTESLAERDVLVVNIKRNGDFGRVDAVLTSLGLKCERMIFGDSVYGDHIYLYVKAE